MTKKDLENIIVYLVNQALEAIEKNTQERNLPVDYVAIFSKNKKEFENLTQVALSLGHEIEKQSLKTGLTILLNQPIQTPAGPLRLIKIRKPDPTRPQRGAPDFRVPDYKKFKDSYLYTSSNFALIIRKDYDMIELKGVDVLVYFPSEPLGDKYIVKP